MSFEPLKLPPEMTSPESKKIVWLISAIVAVILSGVAQGVGLVKGCRAEDVGLAAQANGEKVGKQVTTLSAVVDEKNVALSKRDAPQVEQINALVLRIKMLELLVISEASSRGASNYRAKVKKQPELKVIAVPKALPPEEATEAVQAVETEAAAQ
jgi:hypothetical protein